MSSPAHEGQRDEGVTLVEVLVTITIFLSVIGGVTTSVVSALRAQTQQVQQADAIVESQRAFDRMTREIRQANPVVAAAPDSVRIEVTHNGIRRVTQYTVAGPTTQPRTINQTVTTTTIASGVTVTSTTPLVAGVMAPAGVFRFFEDDGTELTVPIDPTLVTRVDVAMPMRLLNTANLVDLSTSVSLRNRRF